MNRNLISFFIFIFLFISISSAQIDSLVINGSDTSFTMVTGSVLTWRIHVASGVTSAIEVWLDVNNNGIIDTSTDKRRYSLTQTDGSNSGGIPDMDGTLNGIIYLEYNLGIAPGTYLFQFTVGALTVTRRGTITPLPSPAHSISGHVTPPPGKSAQYLFMEARRSGHSAVPESWEGLTDALGNYVIYTDADTSGNPWEIRFAEGSSPYPPSVPSPSKYSITLTGNPSVLDFTFSAVAAKVVGYLKDEIGNPIPNRGVSINNQDFSLFRRENTNESGYFEIGLMESELSDSTFRLASYFIFNTDDDMIGVKFINGIHNGDSLFYNLVSYHVNSSIQGQVLVNGNPPGFRITIGGNVYDTAMTFTIADSATGNFSLPVSGNLYNYIVSPNNWEGSYNYHWNSILAHPGQTGLIIHITHNVSSPQYSLSLNSSNGTITKSPNQSFYDSSSVVQLTAIPNSGYHFTGWSGDISGTSNPVFVMMNSNKNITAMFAQNQFTINVQNKWNLVSLPYQSSGILKPFAYPTAVSNAFAYEGSYDAKDSLKSGVGYWLKFNGEQQHIHLGNDSLYSLSVDVVEGWNLLGSLSIPFDISSITSEPPGLVTSQFYSYAKGYEVVETIQPGKAYWVKVNQEGELFFSTLPASAAKKIKIVPMR
ncbi:MAG: hypothetical protein HY960_11950 [Ignavibacteriae bacterium]|nr:hypothetical protein [Ignavibacteriota bacterium]